MPAIRFILLLTTSLCLSHPRIAIADEKLDADIAAQVKAARAILDPWHGKSPEAKDRYLHIVYWTPSDRPPSKDFQGRLTRILEHIQAFYAREMDRLGFGPRSIKLHYDAEKKLVIHVVKGDGPYADYNVQSGRKIRTECLPALKEAGIDPDRETLVIFCNMADWDPEKKVFRHRSPYYAGGSARSGTAWQLDSPELDTTNLELKEPMIRDGQYGRISLGKHNSIFIGGIAHELGHALGLPHNRERPDEKAAFGTALMGSGNRSYGDELRGEGKGSFLTLSHGLRLASHPQFSGSVKGMNRPVRARFSEFEIKPAENSFSISGTIDSETPVYAVIGYRDPDGGSDYDAMGVTTVADHTGRFTLDCTPLVPGRNAALNIVACHVNGATSRHSFRYSVGKDGKPDLTTSLTKLALDPLIETINTGDKKAAFAALKKIHKDAPGEPGALAHRIGKRLIAAGAIERPRFAPSEIGADTKTIPLGDTKSESAKVGWHRPFVDRTPPPTTVLSSGGCLFEHGIYAHAPADHRFSLSKKWEKISGSCGLSDGSRGSVVFVIGGDGKELWRSPLTKPGSVHPFEIDVSEISNLELTVEDGGDGNGSDWGLWLEPSLIR